MQKTFPDMVLKLNTVLHAHLDCLVPAVDSVDLFSPVWPEGFDPFVLCDGKAWRTVVDGR